MKADLGSKKQTQTNPIYPGVASGEDGTNPISHVPCLLFEYGKKNAAAGAARTPADVPKHLHR